MFISNRCLVFGLCASLFAAACASLFVAACAVPVPPSGGGPDTLPPRLLETAPRQGATNISGRSIEIMFSEAVDRGSFARAWSISPDMPAPADLSWNGFDRVRISFPEPFRAATTYIFTVDTALRDVRNVALTTPISLAFATGSALDSGRIDGHILDPITGKPVQGMDVLLLEPDGDGASGLPQVQNALYRTQTDPEGRFSLGFLAERAYSVVAHGDQNRNRQLDSGERWAVAATQRVTPDSAGVTLPRPLWPVRFDTTAPRVVRVRAASNRDLVLRVSEPLVSLFVREGRDDDAERTRGAELWLVDSLNAAHPAPAPFATPDPLAWQLRVEEPLAPGPWRLRGGVALVDSAGLPVAPGEWPFTIRGTEPEAAPARMVHVEPFSSEATEDGFHPLWPRDSLVLVWSAPPERALDRLIALEDTAGTQLLASVRAISPVRTAVSRPVARVDSGAVGARVNLFRLVTTDTSFTVRVMGPADTGDIVGTVQAPAPTIIELYPANQQRSSRPNAVGPERPVASVQVPEGTRTFRFDRLPGGFQYRLRAFVDLDGSGTWTPGRFSSWMAAEPLLFAIGTDPVRARWESVRADTLTFPQ